MKIRNFSYCPKSSIFVQKFDLIFRENCQIFLKLFFFGWKTRENVVVLDFLAVDNFDFTRKIIKKILGEKLVKMLGFCQSWIFGQEFDFLRVLQNIFFCFTSSCNPDSHHFVHWLHWHKILSEYSFMIFSCLHSHIKDHPATLDEKSVFKRILHFPMEKKSWPLFWYLYQDHHSIMRNPSFSLHTVFENHRKSLIQHCERSELR